MNQKYDRAVANAARQMDVVERARRAAPIETLDEVVRKGVRVHANRDPFGGRYDDTL